MRKKDELADPTSCLNRAKPDEMVFVLLGRDLDTPGTIRDWAGRRVKRGKSTWASPEIVDALRIADEVEAEQRGAAEVRT